jgi:tRNA G10  N-methylase Trm11
VAKLFFLLSGENETLPAAELAAILEAENFSYRLEEKLDQVVRLEADIESIKAVHHRSAYTMISGLELFSCDVQEAAITEMAENTDFATILNAGESFVVRIKRVKEHAPQLGTVPLESQLGRIILNKILF